MRTNNAPGTVVNALWILSYSILFMSHSVIHYVGCRLLLCARQAVCVPGPRDAGCSACPHRRCVRVEERGRQWQQLRENRAARTGGQEAPEACSGEGGSRMGRRAHGGRAVHCAGGHRSRGEVLAPPLWSQVPLTGLRRGPDKSALCSDHLGHMENWRAPGRGVWGVQGRGMQA